MYRKRIGERAPYQPPLPDPTKTQIPQKQGAFCTILRERSVFNNFVQHVAIREFVRK